MNDLTVFSKDVLPVYTTDTGEKVVIGRELHESLKITSKYADWFKNMCAYGFIEGEDFTAFSKNLENGGRTIEHLLKLDMAKHIAMIQRTPEGKAIRDKLISLETNISQLSPELRTLIAIETRQQEQAKQLEQVNQRLDSIGDVVALSPTGWRADTKNIIVRIAHKLGGNKYIRDVHREVFGLVNERASVNLGIRLDNMRKRMALNGTCKSKLDALTKLDVIAEDKKLIEIYLAIVKEMAVKYGVTL